jgi:hypothetical protein
MVLLGELLLHQIIDGYDLLGQSFILLEAFRHEGDLGNGTKVWNHHCYWSEQASKVVW